MYLRNTTDQKRAKKMSRILFLSLNGIRSALACAMLTGCSIESDFIYVLEIKNELPKTVNYCDRYEFPECRLTVRSSEIAKKIYRARSTKDMEDPVAYDSVRVDLCGEPIEFRRISAISPVSRLHGPTFKVIINKKVYEAFCTQHTR